jgi:AAA+ superfamily predicted ATPase
MRQLAIQIAKANDSGVVDKSHVFLAVVQINPELIRDQPEKLKNLQMLVEAGGRPKMTSTPKVSLLAERLMDEIGMSDKTSFWSLLVNFLEPKTPEKPPGKRNPGPGNKTPGVPPVQKKENSNLHPARNSPAKRDINEVLEDLDALVGLSSVKKRVKELVNMQKVNRLREKKSLPPLGAGLNLVFTGEPGTGKTSVARIVAEVYSSLGLLERGHLVEAARQDLVGVFLGQTATKTAELVESALGGVLFIDEAYSLSPKDAQGGRDYGNEAIATLIQLMESHRHELAVFVAGYTVEMEYFLGSNPGLRSRFSNSIEFKSYYPGEMVEITTRLLGAQLFSVGPEIKVALEAHYQAANYKGSMGNGRYARNLVDQMMINMSNRLGQQSIIETRALTSFTQEDVPRAKNEQPVKRIKLGFQAD